MIVLQILAVLLALKLIGLALGSLLLVIVPLIGAYDKDWPMVTYGTLGVLLLVIPSAWGAWWLLSWALA